MTPVRPLLVLAVGGAALVLGGVPARATVAPAGYGAPSASESEALGLLESAARSARARTWSGTQYLSTWRGASTTSEVLQLRHDPATGTRVVADTVPAQVRTVPAAALDDQLLDQLAAGYRLVVTGTGTCSGRAARVVEARRAGGSVAARFWLDAASGLPLRRELWDAAGHRLRSSAFVDLQVDPPATAQAASLVPAHVPAAVAPVDDLPAVLPGGLALFSVAHPVHDGVPVLHASYSDGLSTVSVFRQPGSLGAGPGAGYRALTVDGTRVWARSDTPERLVWSADGAVLTVVSDLAHDDLLAVVPALPHQRTEAADAVHRFGRGLARVGSWLDPTG